MVQLQAIYGEPIPAGRYWLDAYGNWGYEGRYQTMGNIYTDNRAGTGQSNTSGESGAWVENYGSSGSIMRGSDGCMYVSGGGVSASTC